MQQLATEVLNSHQAIQHDSQIFDSTYIPPPPALDLQLNEDVPNEHLTSLCTSENEEVFSRASLFAPISARATER